MADRYWIASSTGNWNSTANWSATSGGTGGASVPSSSDDVFFDANGLGNCTMNLNFGACRDLTLATGWGGTFTQTVNFFTCHGTLTNNSGCTIDMGTRDFVIRGPNGSIADSLGTFTGTPGLLRFISDSDNKTLTCGSATFDVIVGVNMDSLTTPSTRGNVTFRFAGNVTFNKDFLYGYNKLYGSLVIDNGTNNTDLTFNEDITPFITNGTATWTAGTGTITLSGDDANIDFNGESIEDVEIDSTGTKTLTGTVTMGNLTLTDGTLDVNGNNVTCDNITMTATTSIID